MSSRILLVEDEPALALTLSDLLAGEGYTVDTAADGKTGFERALREPWDLIILDVMLPGLSGLDVCRELRQHGKDTAILMLTARSQLTDRVVGLKLGADDYLTKPFEPPELLARVEALLRRIRKDKLRPVVRFEFADIAIDFESAEVRKGGAPVPLAAKELELLRYLVDHRGKVVSREELLEAVWEYQPGVSSRTIDVHVAWLRQKLEDNPGNPRHIHTVRGVGYRFSA
jgi:two-component system alkaline phosphatase synthesis response regulator PhoP